MLNVNAVQASNGDLILEEWSTTYFYNGDGTVAWMQKTNPSTGAVYRQTFVYAAGLLTSSTAWVKQ